MCVARKKRPPNSTWVRVLDFWWSSTGFFFLSCALARSSADRANYDRDHHLMSKTECACVRASERVGAGMGCTMPEFLSVDLARSRAGRLSAFGGGESSCVRSSETELTSTEADPSDAPSPTSVTDSTFMLLYGRSDC